MLGEQEVTEGTEMVESILCCLLLRLIAVGIGESTELRLLDSSDVGTHTEVVAENEASNLICDFRRTSFEAKERPRRKLSFESFKAYHRLG